MSLVPVKARQKIIPAAQAERTARAARRRGKSVVFTNGCFDLLHAGHLRGLEEARRQGDLLIVGVNRDTSVRRLKGAERPVIAEAERMELIAGLACVDWVVGFAAKTPLALIKRLRPHVLAKGGDWAAEDIIGGTEVESWGGRIHQLRLLKNHSTTGLIERIRRSPPRRKR